MFFGSLSLDEQSDLMERCSERIELYLDEHMLSWKRVHFVEEMLNNISKSILEEGKQFGLNEEDEEELENWLKDVFNTVLDWLPPRQGRSSCVKEKTKDEIDNILRHLNTFPKQIQRSEEWFRARQQLFSASNIWKLFGTVAQRNSLLREKIIPPETIRGFLDNSVSPLNWGIKYEPVSVMIYENKYQTKVNTNYGCIPHATCRIGASPDGIVCDCESEKYGHMVEIKNIFNREMYGIPSEPYWVQIQIQLETCQLDVCDFVETRIKEYDSPDAFFQDTETLYKGIVLFLIPRDSVSPTKYFYMPLHIPYIRSEQDIFDWFTTIEEKESECYIIYHIDYWYLDEFICMEIERNQEWFSVAKPIIDDAWKEVLEERIHEFNVNESSKWTVTKTKSILNSVCLIKLPSDEEL